MREPNYKRKIWKLKKSLKNQLQTLSDQNNHYVTPSFSKSMRSHLQKITSDEKQIASVSDFLDYIRLMQRVYQKECNIPNDNWLFIEHTAFFILLIKLDTLITDFRISVFEQKIMDAA